MVTTNPSQPPLWRSLALGGAITAAVGLVAVWLMDGGTPDAVPVAEGMVVDEDGEVVDRRVRFEADRQRRRRAAIPPTSAAQILGMIEGAGPGAVPATDLQAARDSFDAVIEKIELAAERPRSMRQREWREFYRVANDSFAALSAQLDGKDPKQAKELEAAHHRLVTALSIVRVRGGKFRNP